MLILISPSILLPQLQTYEIYLERWGELFSGASQILIKGKEVREFHLAADSEQLTQATHPLWLRCKEFACNGKDPSSIPGSGRFPGGREWQPSPVLLLGEFHGQRSLQGYSPWIAMIEWLSLSLSESRKGIVNRKWKDRKEWEKSPACILDDRPSKQDWERNLAECLCFQEDLCTQLLAVTGRGLRSYRPVYFLSEASLAEGNMAWGSKQNIDWIQLEN